MVKKISFINAFEYKKLIVFFNLLLYFFNTCQAQQVLTGAEQFPVYLSSLKGKKIGLVVNQTSTIGSTHLVDTFQKLNIKINVVFAPEHGFRGNYSAGEKVKSGVDKQSGLKVISLYGNNKKPTPQQLKGLDYVIFDIQDVGARFYTYISTLHYVMEACAESGIKLLILDRPNPNGFYVDGPVLNTNFKSFVGMHPVPIVHGLTVAEYAQMINGEGWLQNNAKCQLHIVKMQGYDHNYRYTLPIKPSPNLPTMSSVYLYPSLCLFEGTNYSLGRGTTKPFECLGKPTNRDGDYLFTPKSLPGVADNPPHMNQLCRGYDLSLFSENVLLKQPRLYIQWLIDLYEVDSSKASFFNPFFDKLAGTDSLRLQIIAGKSEQEIRESWEKDLHSYRTIRMKYLLYPDYKYIYKAH